jgi:hypothetical protein
VLRREGRPGPEQLLWKPGEGVKLRQQEGARRRSWGGAAKQAGMMVTSIIAGTDNKNGGRKHAVEAWSVGALGRLSVIIYF